MAEMLAKLFKPVGCTPSASGNGSSARDRDKLKNICATAREVLLSYVKTDANLDTHPGAIRMPGNLFRRREIRKRKTKESSSETDTSPILDMMINTEDGVRDEQNDVETLVREKPPSSKVKDNHATGDTLKEDNEESSSIRRSTRSYKRNDDSNSKISAHTDETSRNADQIHGDGEGHGRGRIPLRRSTRTRSTGVSRNLEDCDSKTLSSLEGTSRNGDDTDENTGSQSTLKRSKRTRSTDSSENYEDSDSKMFFSPDEKSRDGEDTDENTESQSTDRITLRRSTRSTRSAQFDDPGDLKTQDSGTENENESTGKRKRAIESSQSSNDALSTATSAHDYMHSPDGVSTKSDKGSKKKRRSEVSYGSLANSRVHFSPEVDFGGLSPINRRSSRNHAREDTLLSSSETKTRGSTPPSSLRDTKFSATASIAFGSTRSPDTKGSESPTPVSQSTTNHSVPDYSSQKSDEKTKPLGDKKVEVSRPRQKHLSTKLPVDDKENAITAKKKKAIPKQIKIVRSKPSPKGKVSKVIKKKSLKSAGKRGKSKSSKPMDSFDFEG